MPESKSPLLKKISIDEMISTRDFSTVEGRIPEFVSVLFQVSVPLMNVALEYALENEKIRKETNKYIHETTKSVISEYAAIGKQEQQGINETNKRLGDALIQLTKVENPSADQVILCFEILRTMKQNTERLKESAQNTQEFIAYTQENEKITISKKQFPIKSKLLEIANTPESSRLMASLCIALVKKLTNEK